MTLDLGLVAAALPAYDLEGELGRGGWGVVIGGRHRQLGREVAVKQLPRAFAADPAVRARFVAEARLLAGFDHPHIVPVYDFVELDRLCLLVMEKLPGGTVWSRFSADGLSMDAACAITLATCAALQCAHGAGVLHRDVKPENLLFSGAEVLKVTDFGIAKMVGGSQTLATRAGEVLGTPAYMAPEQAQARELTPATDVYATGTMLYELLAGRLPFPEDGDALAVVFRHVYEEPAPLAGVAPHVPAAICDVVMRAIATDPEDRYGSAEGFGVALAEAATSAWQPGWLGRGGLPVMAANTIVAVTERASGPIGAGPAPRTVGGEPASGRLGGAAAPTTLGAAPIHGPPAPSVPTRRARPSLVLHHGGGRLDEVDAGDLVPVKEVLRRPPPATPLVLAALGLVLGALVLAFAGLGGPDRPPGEIAGLTLNGAAAGGAPIELNLAAPVVVAGVIPDGGEAAIPVTLRFSAGPAPLGATSATAEAGGDGTFTASIDAAGVRYLAVGRMTAEVELGSLHQEFAVTSAQPPLLSAPGIGGIALLLFVAAYAESLLRSRRRGHKRVMAPVGMVGVGALAGVAAVVAAWLLGDREPQVRTVVACAALGAVAGVAAVAAAARHARRRRRRPRSTRSTA